MKKTTKGRLRLRRPEKPQKPGAPAPTALDALRIDTMIDPSQFYFEFQRAADDEKAPAGVRRTNRAAIPHAATTLQAAPVAQKADYAAGVASAFSFAPPTDARATPGGANAPAAAPQTLGPKWFDMAAPKMTPELERELRVLAARGAVDPKRFYKKSDRKTAEPPKFFQVGAPVASAAGYYGDRVPRRQQKQSLVDALLADEDRRRYLKTQFQAVQAKKRSGSRQWYKTQRDRRRTGSSR